LEAEPTGAVSALAGSPDTPMTRAPAITAATTLLRYLIALLAIVEDVTLSIEIPSRRATEVIRRIQKLLHR
jgi:hypothetical protein